MTKSGNEGLKAFNTLLIKSCVFLLPASSEVTGKAIEETAAVVLRLCHDRKHKCSMPGITKRY